MFCNQPTLFICAIALVPVFGIGLAILGVWWIKTLTDTMILMDDKIIKREGLLSKYMAEIFYRDVKSIQIKQSFWQRVFDVGSIGIASSGQYALVLVFHGHRNPEGIKATIAKEVQRIETAIR
ncbi:MAG: PH domain-containing protein [Candidatus Sumerlaeota bacterium]|nr:PH domain-containing protein [Candidatus Sumerlaeota bacterium]